MSRAALAVVAFAVFAISRTKKKQGKKVKKIITFRNSLSQRFCPPKATLPFETFRIAGLFYFFVSFIPLYLFYLFYLFYSSRFFIVLFYFFHIFYFFYYFYYMLFLSVRSSGVGRIFTTTVSKLCDSFLPPSPVIDKNASCKATKIPLPSPAPHFTAPPPAEEVSTEASKGAESDAGGSVSFRKTFPKVRVSRLPGMASMGSIASIA